LQTKMLLLPEVSGPIKPLIFVPTSTAAKTITNQQLVLHDHFKNFVEVHTTSILAVVFFNLSNRLQTLGTSYNILKKKIRKVPARQYSQCDNITETNSKRCI
jgi:hypothetical protein